MSEEEDSPGLPPLPDQPSLPTSSGGGRRQRNSSSESGGSQDSELAQIPPPPVGGQKKDVLEEIPYPSSSSSAGRVLAEDMDIDIPLPGAPPPADSSSRYSPSHVLGGEEEEEISSPSSKKSVLGKAQAKKRLMAFSAAKAAAAAASIVSPTSTTSSIRKSSPLKPVSVKPPKPEPMLAIQKIKEEETQYKEMLAMNSLNSLLTDKLHQVKLIATTIPTISVALTGHSTNTNQHPPALDTSTCGVIQTAIVKPLSEPTIDSSSHRGDEPRRGNKKSKRRHSSSSSSRSRSRSNERKSGKKKSKRSKSRSRSKERKSKKSRRSRSREKDRKNRRSKSRSPSHEAKKVQPRSSRMSPPEPKPRKRDERSKDREAAGRNVKGGDRDRERRRSGSGGRGRGKMSPTPPAKVPPTPPAKVPPPKSTPPERNPKFDKVRKSRMPEDWVDYKKYEYNTGDISSLWIELIGRDRDRERSESPSDSPRARRSSGSVVEHPTPLSKTLAMPARSSRIVLANGLVGEFPFHLIKYTKCYPRISYGFNRLTCKGYYKTRDEICKNEIPSVLTEMSAIWDMSASPPETQPLKTLDRESRDWFALSEQGWCPSEGGKGILISHLYSEDEESKSPFPVMKDEGVVAQPGRKETSEDEEQSEDEASMESIPSPLLRKRYLEEEDEPPSPLLAKVKAIPPSRSPLAREVIPAPPVTLAPVLPPSPKDTTTATEEEDAAELKLNRKRAKKDKKLKRKIRKRERTSSEEVEEVEDEKHRRKKEKKKRSKREKSSSGEEDEVKPPHKGKKKKSKKSKGSRRDRSASPGQGGDRKPPPGSGAGSAGRRSEPDPGEPRDRTSEHKKSDKSGRGHGHKDDRGKSGGRRRNYEIDGEAMESYDGSELSTEHWSESEGWDGEEEERKMEIYNGEADELDPEARQVLSSFENDEFFQLFYDGEDSNSNSVEQRVDIPGPLPVIPPEKASAGSESSEGPVSIKVEAEKVMSPPRDKVRVREEVREERDRPTFRPRERDRDWERGRERHRRRSRSRSRSPGDYYYSSRPPRHYHHHHRYRRRSVSDERRYEGYRYGGRGGHRYRSSRRSPSRSPSPKNVRIPKNSPPLQLNVADSTISDADLDQPKPSPVPPTSVPSGPGFIGGISKDVLLDSKAHHFNPDNFSSTGGNVAQPAPPGKRTNSSSSPPRRLSLDERLELEMGIKLRDEAPKPVPPPPVVFYPPPGIGQPPPFYHSGHGGIPFPPPPHGHVHPQMYPGAPPPPHWQQQQPFGGPPLGQQFPRPRQQSQVIQIGNMLRVLPGEIPTAPITITCSSTSKNHKLNGEFKEQETVRKRVVTIKVPVVPFNVPMIEPSLGPSQAELDEQRLLRRKRRAKKLRQLEKKKLVEAKKEEKARRKEEKAKEKEAETTGNPKTGEGEDGDEVSAEELALLKEAISQSFEEEETGEKVGEDASSAEGIGEEPMGAEEGNETIPIGGEVEGEEPQMEVPEVTNPEEDVAEVQGTEEREQVEEAKEEIPKALSPVPVLPPPEIGILVPFGLRDRNREKKNVKFADGIHPGCGSSVESCGEDMPSPPPPTAYPYKKSFTKEKNGANNGGTGGKKKKIKVKILRTKVNVQLEETGNPPPSPPTPYPFCPIGILYQVCPQYAVLYAQTMAEKGYDIVFEPSTQHPYGEDTLKECQDEGMGTEETPLPEGHYPYPHGGQPEWSPSSTQLEPVSKIPTILTSSRHEPHRNPSDLEEIDLPRSPTLAQIPLPSIQNPNLLVISPTKIPLPPAPILVERIPLPRLESKGKKSSSEGREVKRSISIPLSRIVADKRRNGGGSDSKVSSPPTPQPLYPPEFDYDFTPAMAPLTSVDLSRPPPAFTSPEVDSSCQGDYGDQSDQMSGHVGELAN